MLEKNNPKVSVLRMMGAANGDTAEPNFVVPHNSVTNMRHRMGLTERQTSSVGPTSAMVTQQNSTGDVGTPQSPNAMKCMHCENMAKNFLYLESLLRNNYNPKFQCSLCYSAMKYLQYVNKSIMKVFGNFDSIVQAAKVFSQQKVGAAHTRTKRTTTGRLSKKSGSHLSATVKKTVSAATAPATGPKKPVRSKIGCIKPTAQSKGSVNSMGDGSHMLLASAGGRKLKQRSKSVLKRHKSRKSMTRSGHSVVSGGSGGSAATKNKKKSGTTGKIKSSISIREHKHRHIKLRRKHGAVQTKNGV